MTSTPPIRTSSVTSFDLESYAEERRQRVDQALAALLVDDASVPSVCTEGMRYAVLEGGKRMRPLVVFAACEAAGGSPEEGIPAACAIELIHAYSLVHDDLPAMDNDLERRGKPTVHVAFGEASAILIGDALLTLAFEVLAAGARQHPRARIASALEKLARHAGVRGMVGGQVLDLAHGQDVRDLATLERVHAWKTGALYAASGAMGGLCAGADDDAAGALERFGMAFGIAFQHADDMLDDQQVGLQETALRRVDELSGQCEDLAAGFGERGRALSALAAWVRARAHRARSGDKAD